MSNDQHTTMATSPKPTATTLDPITSLYHPQTPANPRSNSGPDLIILCSWMAASKKHITKYIHGYTTLYPSVPVLLIEATIPNMFRPAGSDLTKAKTYLASFIADHRSATGEKPRVVLHAMSNGGAYNAVTLAAAMDLELEALVLDCTPGTTEPGATTRAFAFSLPRNAVVRAVGYWSIFILVWMLTMVSSVMGWEDLVGMIRRRLNEGVSFGEGVRRLYLYSAADDLVGWRDVHAHAVEAVGKGYEVREERFERALHCALVMDDGERYWGTIRRLVSEKEGE